MLAAASASANHADLISSLILGSADGLLIIRPTRCSFIGGRVDRMSDNSLGICTCKFYYYYYYYSVFILIIIIIIIIIIITFFFETL